MVHLLKKERLGVRPIARIVERQILPGTRLQGVIPGEDALDDDGGGFRPIALPDEFLAGRELADLAPQAAERSDIGRVDGRVVF